MLLQKDQHFSSKIRKRKAKGWEAEILHDEKGKRFYSLLFKQSWKHIVLVKLDRRPCFYSEIVNIAHVVVITSHQVIRNHIDHTYFILQHTHEIFFIIDVVELTAEHKMNSATAAL